jgi:putative ABC transport system permease protein
MKAAAVPLRNLVNHRLRSGLTALGIAAALGSLLALVGLSRGADRSMTLSLEDRGTHIIALKRGSVELLTAALDERLADRLRLVPGVVSAVAGLGDFVELSKGEMAYMAGWPADSDFWRTMKVTAGKVPAAGDVRSVVLGQALAEVLGKRPGDVVELSGELFRVAAVSKQASVIDDHSVMMPLSELQRLLGREGRVSGFYIRIDRPGDPRRMADVRAALSAQAPELSFVESGEIARQTHITRLLHAMAWGSSVIALAMAFVIVLNTLLMAVNERTREIALLSAIGWNASRVMAIIVLEGVMLAAAGSVMGVGLGLAGLRWMTRHPQIGGFLQPDVTPELILEAIGMALLVGALGGLYPAWRAVRMRPMELLRGE